MTFAKPKTARRTKAPASPAQQFQRKAVILLGQMKGLPAFNRSVLHALRRHWGGQSCQHLEANIIELEKIMLSYEQFLRQELSNIKGILHDQAKGVSIQRRNVSPNRPWQETIRVHSDP